MKKYQIIYADPPWYFPANYGKIDKSKLSGFGAELRYNLMSDTELLSLPIGEIAEDNSALFLWVVNSRVDFGIEVLKNWGFSYKTVAFNWIKTARDSGMPNCRLGYWTLGGSELCLLGVKGKIKPIKHNIRQVVLHPRIGHSVKPSTFRDNIVLLFGDLPRIELFARQKVEGWDCWGNEVPVDADNWEVFGALGAGTKGEIE